MFASSASSASAEAAADADDVRIVLGVLFQISKSGNLRFAADLEIRRTV